MYEKCPYFGGECDMKCGPSEYMNCTWDSSSVPCTYLRETEERVKENIIRVCRERNITLSGIDTDQQ
jgi:hypothetical protein